MRPRPLGPKSGAGPVDELLGPGHPLARDLASRAAVARDGPVVLVAGACGIVAALSGLSWGVPVVLSAAAALVLLGGTEMVVRARERTHARALILEGREQLPLPAVERERRRLLSPRLRRRLADSLLEMIGPGAARAANVTRGAPPLFHVVVLREVAPDIRRLAAMLRDEPSGARPVALVERLLTNGLSPLYGDEAEALREELRRLQYLLSR
jgi:hypothetical protein